MIKTKNDLRFYLEEDGKANRIWGGNYLNANYMFRLLCGSESATIFRYLKTLRYCEYHSNNSGLWHRLCSLYYHLKLNKLGLKYNLSIPINVCGYGLTIYHLSGGGGVLVNAKKIGNYCKLQTGVLLGNKNHSEDEKPTVGDNVGFGPGVKVLGKVTIGDNCFIAANAVVVKDMPSNSIIAGVPAKVIKRLLNNEVIESP